MRKLAVLVLLLAGAAALAGAPAKEEPALSLRLLPIKQALKKYADGTDPRVTTLARQAGLDMDRPPHPMLAWSYQKHRLFYVFYNDLQTESAPQDYLLQRVRRQERTWKSARDRRPRSQESFLVEAFRLRGGAFVGSDRHHARFELGPHHKREVRKEFEVGFARLAGVAQGKAWPFDGKERYHKIQDYDPKRGSFDKVKFTRSVKWTLTVSFDRDGNYAVRCPELGFDAPRKLPRP